MAVSTVDVDSKFELEIVGHVSVITLLYHQLESLKRKEFLKTRYNQVKSSGTSQLGVNGVPVKPSKTQ